MKRTINRILSVCVTLSIVISLCLFPGYAAHESDSTSKKTNLTMLSDDIYNIVYTYEEDGKLFKVIEHANDVYDQIHTEIYEFLPEAGEFLLSRNFDSSLETDREAGIIALTVTENGQSTTTMIETSIDTDTQVVAVPFSTNAGWTYATSYYGSSKLTIWTVTIVTAVILGAIGGAASGPVAGGAVSGISTLVGLIIQDCIPELYFIHDVYYLWPQSGAATHEHIITSVFEDKERTKFIGLTDYINEIYDPNQWPSS